MVPSARLKRNPCVQCARQRERLKNNSCDSRRPNLVSFFFFLQRVLRPCGQQNAPLKLEANTLDIVVSQTKTPLQHVFRHMLCALQSDMGVHSTTAQIHAKCKIHSGGTFVDDELKPSSTGILCVAQSDSIRTVRTRTQASTQQNDVQQDHGHFGSTASFLDRARWLQGVLVHSLVGTHLP